MNRGVGRGDGVRGHQGSCPAISRSPASGSQARLVPYWAPAGPSSSRVKGHRTTPSHREAQGVMCHTHFVLTTRPQGPPQASTAFVFGKRL